MIKKAISKINGLDKKWKITAWTGVSIVVVFAIATASIAAYGSSYQDKVLPGVHVGEFNVGGMTHDELVAFLDNMTTKRIKEGVVVAFDAPEGKKEITLTPGISADDSGFDVFTNVQKDADRIFGYGKVGNIAFDSWSAVVTKWIQPDVELHEFSIDETSFLEDLDSVLEDYSEDPVNASIVIDDVDPLEYTITTSSPGLSFTVEDAYSSSIRAWKHLASAHVVIESFIDQPEFIYDDVLAAETKLDGIFHLDEHSIVHYDEHTKRNYTWTISKENIGEWLVPKRVVTDVTFGLDASSTMAFVTKEILPDIEVEPRDAEFELNDAGTKAIHIVGHRPGITVDTELLLQDLDKAIQSRIDGPSDDIYPIKETELNVVVVEPEITLESTNDLGIKEILGQGSSDFSGSPRNRILNIKNAVYNKLHGTIIKPDEEFSLNATLRPYTIAAGYLPELVIVGNRIKPEVAGGLCQVGTTMFRTAMHSAMPITQRVNHGLVVSYYNDPTNGNPGTDATIYDGWPDFRFKNDTGHHMVVTTYMNANTGELTFTLWGTSDGRQGSYTPPVVSQWIGAGPYKEIQTTDLPPGKKECQGVHPGAVASFTYTRKLGNGEVVSRVFESKYRAVPATCYVGVSKITQCQDGSIDTGCIPKNDASTEESTAIDEDLDKILNEDFGILPADESQN